MLKIIKEEYPDAARLAVTYKNKTVGYPFYFETSSLLYVTSHLKIASTCSGALYSFAKFKISSMVEGSISLTLSATSSCIPASSSAPFFSIDTKEISYDKILDDFIAGKIVYTVATTDAVAKLEEAKENGSFAYDYSIALAISNSTQKLLVSTIFGTGTDISYSFTNSCKLLFP